MFARWLLQSDLINNLHREIGVNRCAEILIKLLLCSFYPLPPLLFENRNRLSYFIKHEHIPGLDVVTRMLRDDIYGSRDRP